MSIFSRFFGDNLERETRTAPVPFTIEEFRAWSKADGFSVEADKEASTILHYHDDSGDLLFCVEDIGFGGRGCVTLDWPRSVGEWTTQTRERIAFQRTKCFLEALGFKVRVSPSEIPANTPPLPMTN